MGACNGSADAVGDERASRVGTGETGPTAAARTKAPAPAAVSYAFPWLAAVLMLAVVLAAYAIKRAITYWRRPTSKRSRLSSPCAVVKPASGSTMRMTTITTAACLVMVGLGSLIAPALGAGPSFGDMKGYDASTLSTFKAHVRARVGGGGGTLPRTDLALAPIPIPSHRIAA